MISSTPHCASPSYRIEVSGSLSPFEQLWPVTGALGDARCYPFQCADVLRVWCETIGRARNVEPFFVAAFGAANEPVFLLPLGIYNSNGTRVVRFLDGGVSDYNAPVVFSAAANLTRRDMQALWDSLREQLAPVDLILLEKMPEYVHDIRNPLADFATHSHGEDCHAVTLNGSWDEFASRHMPSLRDSQRRRRKLDKLGTVRFAIARTENERQRFFAAMVCMKRKRFADTSAHDIFADPGYLEYYTEMTRALGPGGTVQLSALLLNDRILAADWGFVSGNRFYDLMPGYQSGEWRSYSPGRLLTEWMTEQCLEQGMEAFDYGIGDEPYKFRYCNSRISLQNAYVPETVKGAIYGKMLLLQSAAKSLLRETKVGGMLKAARRRIREIKPSQPPTGGYAPAMAALICSATLVADAV